MKTDRDISTSITIPAQHINDIWSEDDGNRLLGTVTMFGAPHHFEAIRVETNEDGHQQGCGEFIDMHERLQAYDGDTADFSTVKIPGFDGDYVIVITPHSL